MPLSSKWTRLTVLSILLVLLLVFSACGQSTAPADEDPAEEEPAEAAEPDDEDEDDEEPVEIDHDPIVILQGVDMDNMDPYQGQTLSSTNIHLHVFETLTDRDADMETQPMLATEWSVISDDNRTWEFKLREDVVFQNGDPMNADAVVFSFERLDDMIAAGVDADNHTHAILDMESIEAVDDYTVHLTTNAPNPVVPQIVNSMWILSPGALADATYEEATRLPPVGTGPYKLTEWVPDEFVRMEAWEDYRDGPPEIKEILWRPVPETATRIAELKAGGADLIVNVPPDLVDDVDSHGGVEVRTVAGGRRIIIGIGHGRNPRHPALEDKRVRQAMNYAFDAESMFASLLGGLGERAGTIVNPPNSNPDIQPYPFDPDKASQLLDEAGWELNPDTGIREKDGEPLSLVFHTPDGRYIQDRNMAQVVSADLEAVGFDIDLQVVEWSVFIGMAANQGEGFGDLHLIGSGTSFTWMDIAFFAAESGSNRVGFENDEFEALYAELSSEFDPDRQRELLWELEDIVREEAPCIFTWFQVDIYAASDRLDWQPRADERIRMTEAGLR